MKKQHKMRGGTESDHAQHSCFPPPPKPEATLTIKTGAYWETHSVPGLAFQKMVPLVAGPCKS